MSTLYIVSTPIGNLGDVSVRAADVLRSVERILAEDTRRSRVLAAHVSSKAPLVSLHAHNEQARTSQVLAWLDAGESLALVSDAGTPLISDPGARLVSAVAAAGHPVVPIPGASAVLAALVASGLSSTRFAFLGFPDRKGAGRREVLDRVRDSTETVVLFESPRRTARLLEDLRDVCGGERPAAVARELTKIHEEIRRGSLEELCVYYGDHTPKGEVTVVVAGRVVADTVGIAEERREEAHALAQTLLQEGLKPSEVAKEIALRLDLPRNDVYRMVQETRDSPENA